MRVSGIFVAILSKNWDAVVKLAPTEIRCRNNNGDSVIHFALCNGASCNVIISLLEFVIPGEMVLDNNGNTYLHCAIVNKASIEIIRAIIAHIPGCLETRNASGQLPIHLAAAVYADMELFTELVDARPSTVEDQDSKSILLLSSIAAHHSPISTSPLVHFLVRKYPGAIHVILEWSRAIHEYYMGLPVIQLASYLILFDLPVNPDGKSNEKHAFSFTWLLNRDPDVLPLEYCEDVIEAVFQKYPNIVHNLANSEDEKGRPAISIPHKKIRKAMNLHLLFMGRYELQPGAPEHQSLTCILRRALDHQDGGSAPRHVALKFMKHQDQYEREISARKLLLNPNETLDKSVSQDFVIALTLAYDSENFKISAGKRGYGQYPYCIVMPAADRNLKGVLDHEHIAGKEWDTIVYILKQIGNSLEFFHEKGVIHGDLKPLNVMRTLSRYKLIDMDASVSFANGEFSGAKYSSAFIPPELVFVDSSGLVPSACVRTYEVREDGIFHDERYDLLPASPKHDVWSFGVVAYQMCTDKTLFHSDGQDNLDTESLIQLANWTNEFKASKLANVQNKNAKNFLSQLLQKEPEKRPTISRALAHPFITGKQATRMVGDKPSYDVFISYRVASDYRHAELMYDALTARGLAVWWDRKCLKPGVSWEDGFCDGLADSLTFVPLLSKNAIDNPESDRQCFARLTAESPIDNVLLEYRLALELKEAGLLERIFPVMIGNKREDSDGEPIYGDYQRPILTNVVVLSVEEKLYEHLDRLALGSPLIPNLSVQQIYAELTENQGGFVKGKSFSVFDSFADQIKNMVITTKRALGELSPTKLGGSSSVLGRISSYGDMRDKFAAAALNLVEGSNRDAEITTLRKEVIKYEELLRDAQETLKLKDENIDILNKELSRLKLLYRHSLKSPDLR